MNMFLDGLPDEDFRGWKYNKYCSCERCEQFAKAIHLAMTEDFNFTNMIYDEKTSSQQPS